MSAATTSEVVEPKFRYREEPLIGELLADVHGFDTEATEATGEAWRAMAKRLRDYAARVERHGYRLQEGGQ